MIDACTKKICAINDQICVSLDTILEKPCLGPKTFIKQGYFGISIFSLLCLISMVLYPGGTIIDSSTVGYLFFYNFLSNLGEWTAKNGDPNFYSAILFNISMIVLSVSYSVFYYNFLMIVIKKSKNAILKFLLISSISISLIGFVCVALFSSDPETFELHILFVKIAFYSLLFHLRTTIKP